MAIKISKNDFCVCLKYFWKVSVYSLVVCPGISSLRDKNGPFILPVSNIIPLFFTFLTTPFFSFCFGSFSCCFKADPQDRGTRLLTLSPEGAGRKLAITMSKYVHAKSPLLRGIVDCLLAYTTYTSETPCWEYICPPFTTVIFSHVCTLTVLTDAFLPAVYCNFLSCWIKQKPLTLSSFCWERVCPVLCRTWVDWTNALGQTWKLSKLEICPSCWRCNMKITQMWHLCLWGFQVLLFRDQCHWHKFINMVASRA